MKPAFHLPRAAAGAIIALLGCLLAGCGQKGPLYLPSKPAAAAVPAPPRTSPPPSATVPPAADPPPASR